ncbi:MAG: hypothetical protein Sw2LagTSB_09440 [Shewanella algae]
MAQSQLIHQAKGLAKLYGEGKCQYQGKQQPTCPGAHGFKGAKHQYHYQQIADKPADEAGRGVAGYQYFNTEQ